MGGVSAPHSRARAAGHGEAIPAAAGARWLPDSRRTEGSIMTDPRATTETTREVVNQFMQHRVAADIDAMMELIADDAEFHSFGSPKADWLGTTTGKSAAREFFTRLFAGITPVDAQLRAIVVDGAEAVILGDIQVTVNATGRTYDSPFALALTVQDGLIARHHVFEDSYALHLALND
jgi:ketosteroid isomerase-like protein